MNLLIIIISSIMSLILIDNDNQKPNTHNGDFYDLNCECILKKNIIKVCGIVDVKSNIIYGYNKKKHPKKTCVIYYGIKSVFKTTVPINPIVYKKDLYVTLNLSDDDSVVMNSILGEVGNIESEKLYTKMLCISNWCSDKKFKISNFKDHNKHIDLCHLNVYSIDPPNCSDIDDAFHVQIYNDFIEIGIHIADVSFFIEKDTHLDNEISKRGKTIYFENETIHMLPLQLMNELSLVENKKRFAFSIIFKFNKSVFSLIDYSFQKSIINVKKNLTYDQAQPLCFSDGNLSVMYKIGHNLYTQCHNLCNYDVHKMVEMFMILTNNSVGIELSKVFPNHVILRIQQQNDFFLQYSNEEYYDKFLQHNKNSAEYVVGTNNNNLHADLNIKFYSHFTSPLRRYVDIINHRLLTQIISKNNDEIYTTNYLSVCVKYYNNLYKWYKRQEKYHRSIDKIFHLHKNNSNIIEKGIILGFIDTNVCAMHIFIPFLNDIFTVVILSNEIKKIVKYSITETTFNNEEKTFELKLFDKIEVQICICLLSVKKILLSLVKPNPNVMYNYENYEY